MVSKYEKGKIRSTQYYGARGELAAGPEGYAYVQYTYSKDWTTETYYNADGTLFYNDMGICGISRKTGRQTTDEICLTGEGKRGSCIDGYSRKKTTFNYQGKVASEEYYDTKDRLYVVKSLGYAKAEYFYLLSRLPARTKYFGADGKLVRCAEGYAIMQNTYEKRVLVETAYYDVDGKTLVSCIEGYARVRYENRDGHVVSEKYYAANGKAFNVDGRYDEVRNTWEGNKKTSVSYWAKGKKVTGSEGYHEARYEFNGAGKETKQSFYNKKGKLTLCDQGYAAMETVFSSKGNAMGKKYYGTNGKLINTPGKEYAFVMTIPESDLTDQALPEEDEEEVEEEKPDEEKKKGNQAEDEIDTGEGAAVEYHGLDGKLMNISAGYAYLVRENNIKGLASAENYYNADGEPVMLPAGYARIEMEYNDDGQKTVERYYGLDGKPVMNRQGYHRVERDYPDPSTVSRKNLKKKTISKIVTEKYFDTESRPVLCLNGYDGNLSVYDQDGKIIRIEYYRNGKIASIPKGYAVLEREYDENGAVAVEKYYNKKDKPVNCTDGYQKLVRTWADPSHATSEAWYDKDGQPTVTNNTYVRLEREFDKAGNPAVEKHYGVDGKPIACRDGYDEIHRTYDGNRQIIRMEYYLNGKRSVIPKGYAARQACELRGGIPEDRKNVAGQKPRYERGMV